MTFSVETLCGKGLVCKAVRGLVCKAVRGLVCNGAKGTFCKPRPKPLVPPRPSGEITGYPAVIGDELVTLTAAASQDTHGVLAGSMRRQSCRPHKEGNGCPSAIRF